MSKTHPTPEPSSHRAALALALLPGVGYVGCWALLARYGSAERAWEAQKHAARAEALSQAERALDSAVRAGARVLAPGDAEYPPSLYELEYPPLYLFARGDVSLLTRPCVAIVGTRSATPYGERITRELAGALVRAGAVVISGLARGIDGAAHRGALEAGGGTVGILGTGIDIAYPASHRALHEQLAERGLLLSEELPGERANGGSFPRRNRIIAALSRVTIVVEAGTRSGALNTCGHAIALGRDVAAVPGRIDSVQSQGANALLRDGAIMIADVADALALMKLTPAPSRAREPHTPAEAAVWEALAGGASDVDTIASAARLPARECLAALTSLELAGAIDCSLTGEIRRR